MTENIRGDPLAWLSSNWNPPLDIGEALTNLILA